MYNLPYSQLEHRRQPSVKVNVLIVSLRESHDSHQQGASLHCRQIFVGKVSWLPQEQGSGLKGKLGKGRFGRHPIGDWAPRSAQEVA